VSEPDFVVEDVEVEIELSGVFGFEFTAFEFEGYEALEVAVEEQEVDEEFFAVDFETVLVADEGEAFAQGHDHVFYIGDELAFDDAFVVFFQGYEVEEVFILEDLQGVGFYIAG